jgi:HK97 family phage portal protein
MNIFSQIKQFFGGKPKPLRKIRLWPDYLDAQPTWALDYNNFIEEGYYKNATLYAAIMYKARASASVKLIAYNGTRAAPEPLDVAHPLARFCDRPNPRMSFSEMQMINTVYLNLFGNSYTVFLHNGQDITAYPLRPDYIRHVYDQGDLAGYIYCTGGVSVEKGTPILSSDVAHVKYPDPADRYGGFGPGISPLYPIAHSVDVDNAATAFLKIFFERGATPPGLLTTEQQLTPDIAEELKQRWLATYGGYRNWSDVMVLGAGATYQRLGLMLSEMDMTNLDARNESRTASVFGVPLTLIESRPAMVASTYSNKATDRQLFWEDTMIPELQMSEVEYQYYLRGDAGEFVAYDYLNIPALIEIRLQRAAAYAAAWDGGAITQNEYRAALNLPPLPSGDRLKLSIGVQLLPIAAAPAPVSEDGAAAATDEAASKEFKMTMDQKASHYLRFDATAQSFEAEAEDAARRAFEADRRRILALVTAAQGKAYAGKETVAWQPVLDETFDYLDTDSQKRWMDMFMPVFKRIILAQGNLLNIEFGKDFNVRNLFGEAWFNDYNLKFATEISQTSADEIKKIFEQAMREGWTVPEMQAQLEILFNQWIDGGGDAAQFALDRLPPQRTELIARDQTLRASNAGADALYRDWGVAQKEWWATPDDLTRESHQIGAAFGQPPLVVGMNDKFTVGRSQLSYPGDPTGALEDVIQCRCTLLPVIPE